MEVKENEVVGSKRACINFSLSFCLSESRSQDDSVNGVSRSCGGWW